MIILLAPDLRTGKGGPSTFQRLLARHISSFSDFTVSYDSHQPFDIVLLSNSSTNLQLLLKILILRKPLVQRLGSRYRSNLLENPSFIASLRYQFQLFLLSVWSILSRHVIYQSEYARSTWYFPRKRTFQ